MQRDGFTDAETTFFQLVKPGYEMAMFQGPALENL